MNTTSFSAFDLETAAPFACGPALFERTPAACAHQAWLICGFRNPGNTTARRLYERQASQSFHAGRDRKYQFDDPISLEQIGFRQSFVTLAHVALVYTVKNEFQFSFSNVAFHLNSSQSVWHFNLIYPSYIDKVQVIMLHCTR
jgi:hypothetical protein